MKHPITGALIAFNCPMSLLSPHDMETIERSGYEDEFQLTEPSFICVEKDVGLLIDKKVARSLYDASPSIYYNILFTRGSGWINSQWVRHPYCKVL